MSNYTYVGMDVHKSNIFVAFKKPRSKKFTEFKVEYNQKGLKELAKRLKKECKSEPITCYEAGFCGFDLQRQLKKLGITCQVIAPSLVPSLPGDRIKTDRRDARKLSEMFRSDLLTEVHPPTEEEEAVRDLCRCREDEVENLQRVRHRLSKMLLRHGFKWHKKSNWTVEHHKWLKKLKFDIEAIQMTFDNYMLGMVQIEERLKTLEAHIERISQTDHYKKHVGWLKCFRGIKTITAMTILSELYCFSRFRSPKKLMSFLGVVPSEHSSGDSIRKGSITKAGNAHVRRVLVESAQHYRKKPAIGYALKQRRKGQPAGVIAIADKAMQRLYRRNGHLGLVRGKSGNKVTIALARELVGFIWAVLYPDVCETK